MWETIRELVRDGATVLLTTQYLDEADQLADRIAVIDRGLKVAEGTPDELKAGVGNSTLHVRLTDKERTAEAAALVARTLGEEPVLTPEAGGLSIALPDADRAADVLIALRQADLGIATAAVRQPTLDEVFLALTGRHAEDEDGDGDNRDDLQDDRQDDRHDDRGVVDARTSTQQPGAERRETEEVAS
jgi:ABC-2 type transport system ATP-binding protein